MNFVRIFLESITASKAKGIGFAILFIAGAGFAIYFSNSSEDGTGSVEGVAITVPPLLRNEPLSSGPMSSKPNIDGRVSDPYALPSRPSDRPSLTRALQTGLRRAECYDGSINGIWSTKSKESMRRFVAAVNAQLPVDDPDQILLALVESNQATICSRAQSAAAVTGEASPSPASTEMQESSNARTEATASQPTPSSTVTGFDEKNSPTIARVWAPSEMLVPPINVQIRPAAVVPSTGGDVEPDRQIKVTPPLSQPQKVAQRRTWAPRQKPATLDGVSKSITKSFKTIQRSLALIFK